MPWTLDELTRRVNGVLQHEGVIQGNGQVAEAPNPRAIRWYQSIGLVRRPQQRGRAAYYGPPHLNELVAIKRFQALGLSLAQIQEQLVGASDERVAAIACVPRQFFDLTVSVSPVTVTDTDIDDERDGWWAAEVDDGPVGAAQPTLVRVAVEVDGATLVLPVGCTATPELAAQLLSELVRQLADGGHLPTAAPPTTSATTASTTAAKTTTASTTATSTATKEST